MSFYVCFLIFCKKIQTFEQNPDQFAQKSLTPDQSPEIQTKVEALHFPKLCQLSIAILLMRHPKPWWGRRYRQTHNCWKFYYFLVNYEVSICRNFNRPEYVSTEGLKLLSYLGPLDRKFGDEGNSLGSMLPQYIALFVCMLRLCVKGRRLRNMQ